MYFGCWDGKELKSSLLDSVFSYLYAYIFNNSKRKLFVHSNNIVWKPLEWRLTDIFTHLNFGTLSKRIDLTIALLETKKSAQLSLCGKIATFKMNAQSSEDILANVRQLEQILGWVWIAVLNQFVCTTKKILISNRKPIRWRLIVWHMSFQVKKIICSPGSPFNL